MEINTRLELTRTLYRTGAWFFDRSGLFAPLLANFGPALVARFFPHTQFFPAPNPFPLDNFLIHHNGATSYHMRLFLMAMHDRDVVRLLKVISRRDMNVLDVGAHLGYFSLLSAHLSGPAGSVWAFEPLPEIAGLLAQNVETNGYGERIHVVRSAVGNAVGRRTLYRSPEEPMLSSLYHDAAAGKAPTGAQTDASAPIANCEQLDVTYTTLDAWAAQRAWPRVDVVKIDVEGAEMAAVQGMSELKRRLPHLKLIVELNPRTLRAAGTTVGDFWNVLRGCGFDRFMLSDRAMTSVSYPADWPKIQRAIRRMGNDRVNLLCETASR